MPPMPTLTSEDRAKITRWEHVVGKALKDWTTRIMIQQGVNREEARQIALKRIEQMDVKHENSADGNWFVGYVVRVLGSVVSWRRQRSASPVH